MGVNTESREESAVSASYNTPTVLLCSKVQ